MFSRSCQKRALGGFHGSSFHCWSAGCDWGPWKARGGKPRQPGHVEPAGPLVTPALWVVTCQLQHLQRREGMQAGLGQRGGPRV